MKVEEEQEEGNEALATSQRGGTEKQQALDNAISELEVRFPKPVDDTAAKRKGRNLNDFHLRLAEARSGVRT